MTTTGELLIRSLEAYGVDTVFGIPGVHTLELYRGLGASPIRHITPRHEQGAGFMADGYARSSGKPGVCFIITGPGMTNIATAMGQAYGQTGGLVTRFSEIDRHVDADHKHLPGPHGGGLLDGYEFQAAGQAQAGYEQQCE